ncbi:MAG: PASTA domain-containing protein [Acidimicrobiales bacterium]
MDQHGEKEILSEPSLNRSWLLLFLAFAFVIAIGALAVSSVDPPGTSIHAIADYKGHTIGEVRAIAEKNLWVLDEDQVRTDLVPEGLVLVQNPSDGQGLAEGKLLSVEVSSGPLLRLTPHILGLLLNPARMRLEARGFEIDEVDLRYSEDVADGQVLELLIGEKSTYGGLLNEPGTRVSLVVSAGPVPRMVPNLINTSLEAATNILAGLQLAFVVNEKKDFKSIFPNEFVTKQTPVSGLSVARNSVVKLTIAGISPTVEVPDVVGVEADEAAEMLKEAGLVVERFESGLGLVEETSPAIGVIVDLGSLVVLKFAAGQ